MEHIRILPLNLQFFADGGEDTEPTVQPEREPDNELSPQAGRKPEKPEAGKPMNMDDFASKFLHAVESRTQRAERATVRSIAEQYGMKEDELSAILEKAKAEKAAQLPPEVQRQIDEAAEAVNSKLIAAEVKTLGADMGLLDADAALTLMDKSGVKVDPNSVVSGVKESLEALQAIKPYLFASAAPNPTGERRDVGGRVVDSGTPEITREQFDKMSYAARVALKNRDPQLYEKLAKRKE